MSSDTLANTLDTPSESRDFTEHEPVTTQSPRNNQNSEPPPQGTSNLIKDDAYYLRDGNCAIRVQNYLFRVRLTGQLLTSS